VGSFGDPARQILEEISCSGQKPQMARKRSLTFVIMTAGRFLQSGGVRVIDRTVH